MSYQVIISKPVQKQLDSLPDDVHERAIKRIMALKENPRPRGCVKLKGYENEYRIRIGDYRVRYEVHEPGVHRPVAPL
jgi:mRNA interferase RelE/StbE